MGGRTGRGRAARPALIILAAASLALASGPTFAPGPASRQVPPGVRAPALRAQAAGPARPLSAAVRRLARLKAVRAGEFEARDRAARPAAWPRPLGATPPRTRSRRWAVPGKVRVVPPLRC